jgi:hypothetical protein
MGGLYLYGRGGLAVAQMSPGVSWIRCVIDDSGIDAVRTSRR